MFDVAHFTPVLSKQMCQKACEGKGDAFIVSDLYA